MINHKPTTATLSGAFFLVITLGATAVAQNGATADWGSDTAALKRHLSRAALGIKSRQFQKAHDEIQRFLDQRPEDRVALTIYGDALLGLKRYKEAQKVYAHLLKGNPRQVKVLYGFGFASEKIGNMAGAIRGYEGALAIDPKHATCRNNLAWILATAPEAELRDGRRAVALIEQSIQQRGREEWWMVDTAAAGLAEMGNFDAAVTMQQMAVNSAPPSKQAPPRATQALP